MTDRELTSDDVLTVLSEYGRTIARKTWSAYVARGEAPGPVRHVGRTPLWSERAVREWVAAAPGMGARTDLRKPSDM